MSLNLDIDVGESIAIGDVIIRLVHKKGRKARLEIDADKSIPVSLRKSRRKIGGENK